MSKLLGVLEYTKILIDKYQNKNMDAIDMTLGNGKDSLYLSNKFNKIYGFDIQDLAIDRSKVLLKDINNVILIKDSHYNFNKYINNNINLMIFNLGYLPNSNKEITTLSKTTIKTIKKGLSYLSINGIMIIVVYRGHKEGYKEHIAIHKLLFDLDKDLYHISMYYTLNSITSPYVIAIHKKG